MIQTRTFDSLCHDILSPALMNQGFVWVGKGVYLRSAADGEDSIGLDIRPTRERFCVLVGYYSTEMLAFLRELDPALDAQNRGYLCRPYLHQEGTSWHPRWWRCNDKPTAIRSLQHALQCIDTAGQKWLADLRDRRFYAQHTDAIASLPSAYAHELAGNLETARERYLEKNRVYGEMEKLKGGIRACKEAWRECIFVKAKLGIEDALTGDLRVLASWNPTIHPLTTD